MESVTDLGLEDPTDVLVTTALNAHGVLVEPVLRREQNNIHG